MGEKARHIRSGSSITREQLPRVRIQRATPYVTIGADSCRSLDGRLEALPFIEVVLANIQVSWACAVR